MANSLTFTGNLKPIAKQAKKTLDKPVSAPATARSAIPSSTIGDIASLASFGLDIKAKFDAARELEGLKEQQAAITESEAKVQGVAVKAFQSFQDMVAQGKGEVEIEKATRDIGRSAALSPAEFIGFQSTLSTLRNPAQSQEILEQRRKKLDAVVSEDEFLFNQAERFVKEVLTDDQSALLIGVPKTEAEFLKRANNAAGIVAAQTEARLLAEDAEKKLEAAKLQTAELSASTQLDASATFGAGQAQFLNGSFGTMLTSLELLMSGINESDDPNALQEGAQLVSAEAGRAINGVRRQMNDDFSAFLANVTDSKAVERARQDNLQLNSAMDSMEDSFTDIDETQLKAINAQLEFAQANIGLSAVQNFTLVAILKEAGADPLVNSALKQINALDLTRGGQVGEVISRGIDSVLNADTAQEKIQATNLLAGYFRGEVSLEELGPSAPSIGAAAWETYRDMLSQPSPNLEGMSVDKMQANLSDTLLFSRKGLGEEVAESQRNALALINHPNFEPFFKQGSKVSQEKLGRQVFAAHTTALLDGPRSLINQIKQFNEAESPLINIDKETGHATTRWPIATATDARRPAREVIVENYNRSIEAVRNFSDFDPSLKDIAGSKSISFILRQAETLGLLEGFNTTGTFVDIPELQDVTEAVAKKSTIADVIKIREEGEILEDLREKARGITEQNLKRTLDDEQQQIISILQENPNLTFAEASNLLSTIDQDRPEIQNPDGTISTEQVITSTFTMGDGTDKTFIIPTIVDGKKVSDREAEELFKKGTNKAIGQAFDSVDAAERFVNKRHKVLQTVTIGDQ